MGMRAEESDQRPIRSVMRRLVRAPWMLSFVWPVILIFGGYIAWHRWGAEYLNSQFYGVEVSQIQVTMPPEYIRTDIVKSVYEDTEMDGLSLLDSRATKKIASAFSTHPWVRHVNSVRKLPGGEIDVRLEYRVPVAMVRVISQHHEIKGKSYFAVDGQGVLLPTNDFTPEESEDYIHISVPNAYPNGGTNFGLPFGEKRVEAAAKVASLLSPHRGALNLELIGVRGDPRETTVPQMELRTRDGRTFFWGSPPGLEVPGETNAETKVRALLLGVRDNMDLRLAKLPNSEPH